ncbi:TPA: hypothetical protein I8Z14_000564 [Legionella pneumophila]|nr:hypothetical protein [Legionella pneumophila]
MSRIRTIKPDFWTSEQVISCSPNARLLFIGLWNFCDDNGVHKASLVRLKAEIFPCDTFTIKDIELMVHELIQQELLYEYIVSGSSYWIVTGWKKHQRIDKPTSRHPLPQSELKKIEDNSTTIPREIDNYSKITNQSFDESSITEWNGKEWIGKESNICEVETSPVDISDSSLLASTQNIFYHWQDVMNHPKAKLDDKRKRTIQKALKNYSVEEIKLAIDGCANTPYNMGENDKDQRYDDIGLILRDADHIERFINNADKNNETESTNNSEDLMAGVL